MLGQAAHADYVFKFGFYLFCQRLRCIYEQMKKRIEEIQSFKKKILIFLRCNFHFKTIVQVLTNMYNCVVTTRRFGSF